MNTTQLHPYIVPQERLEGAPIEDSIGFHTGAVIGQGDDHMALQDNVVEIAIILLTTDIDRPAIRRRQLIVIAQLSELSTPYIEEITKREITSNWGLHVYYPRSIVRVHPVVARAIRGNTYALRNLHLLTINIDIHKRMIVNGSLLQLIAKDAINGGIGSVKNSFRWLALRR